jgi:TatD DNase family protein
MELFDSHAHLQGPEFDDDREVILLHARSAGVTGILLPGEDLTTSQRVAVIAGQFPGVYGAAGFHPHEASRLTPDGLEGIEKLLGQPRMVAVGEIGLDFHYDHSPRDVQVEAFMTQLDLARRSAMPVIVHCRDAWDALDDTLALWAQDAVPAYGGQPLGVLHYYSSDLETAWRYIELGFLISIHTSVTHPKAQALREVAAALPLASLVIETDSPYGAPQAYRGKRNEPAFVIEVAKKIAEVRGESLEAVSAATTANARRLFRLETSSDAVKAAPQRASSMEAAR